jgi:hypothetical protein
MAVGHLANIGHEVLTEEPAKVADAVNGRDARCGTSTRKESRWKRPEARVEQRNAGPAQAQRDKAQKTLGQSGTDVVPNDNEN